jgi:hypothetical protein
MNGDGFYKLCPKCCGVLWTRLSAELARKRAEEARVRKIVQEEATRKRLVLKEERRQLAQARLAERKKDIIK